MKRSQLHFRRDYWLTAIISAIFLASPAQANVPGASSQNASGSKPVPPPFGNSYDVLSQEWWLWDFMLSAPDNPTVPSSALPIASAPPCGNGQSGNVWFLYAVFLPYTQVTC